VARDDAAVAQGAGPPPRLRAWRSTALRSDPPEDPTAWGGDAKVSGRAIEETSDEQRRAFRQAAGSDGEEPPGEFELFRVEIDEVVRTSVGTPRDHLVIELWRPAPPARDAPDVAVDLLAAGLDDVVARALAEDVGPGDVTTRATVPPVPARGRASRRRSPA
jgi:hypothetical protein